MHFRRTQNILMHQSAPVIRTKLCLGPHILQGTEPSDMGRDPKPQNMPSQVWCGSLQAQLGLSSLVWVFPDLERTFFAIASALL